MACKDSAGTGELEEASFPRVTIGDSAASTRLLVTSEIYITNIKTVALSCVGITVTGER